MVFYTFMIGREAASVSDSVPRTLAMSDYSIRR